MSTLKSLIAQLKTYVLASTQLEFQLGREACPVLAPHRHLSSVLEALADDRESTYPLREELSRALLFMHRQSKSQLWSSALAVAYYPMLSRLRYRIAGNPIPGDELDQLVLSSFWATLSEVPVSGHGSDRLPMRLRQRTQRLVFQTLRKECEHQHASLDDDSNGVDLHEMVADEAVTKSVGEERLDLALLLEKAAIDGVPRASLEVLAATVLKRELLRSYVTRVGPSDDVERERMYQRLKRQRSRLLKRLRHLAADC